ncbi:unnamed protein product [Bursaphelenchus xylophilus]|nr:unnamed protein product [Bursaphelenchus xylophilus]CAG9089035.1 unnamed protein product [Bursaphelenchus xylophilus]
MSELENPPENNRLLSLLMGEMSPKLAYLLLALLCSTLLLDSVEGIRKKKKDKNKSRQLPEEKEDEEAKRAHLSVNVDMDPSDDDSSSSSDDDDEKDKGDKTESPNKVDPGADSVYQMGPDQTVGLKSRRKRSHGARHIPVYHVDSTTEKFAEPRGNRFAREESWIYNVL